MPRYILERRVKAPPELVWSVISNLSAFGGPAQGLARVEVVAGKKQGLQRVCHDEEGRSWTETCVEWDEGRSYTLETDVTAYPYPVKEMRYSAAATEHGDAVAIRLTYRYRVRFGLIGRLMDRFWIRNIIESSAQELLDQWLFSIREREWAYTVNVASILKEKGSDIISVTPQTKIFDTARLLTEKRIGSVLVLNPDESIAGVVSERDIVIGLSRQGTSVLKQPVSKIMTRKVVVCEPDYNMVLVMACMTDRRVRHLPVMEGDKVIGIISIGDVVKTRIRELESESEVLHEYIAGRQWREQVMQTGTATGVHEQL
ncbi:MAG: CBS domain-containing protein [Gammaproteobacteria bacterium]